MAVKILDVLGAIWGIPFVGVYGSTIWGILKSKHRHEKDFVPWYDVSGSAGSGDPPPGFGAEEPPA